MTSVVPTIRIVAIPPGEAPLWVRAKWVDLELPLARWSSRKMFLGFGGISGRWSCLGQLWDVIRGRAEAVSGYAVEAAVAVDILAVSNPDAALWWRENTPHLLAPQRCFVFHESVCRMASSQAT